MISRNRFTAGVVLLALLFGAGSAAGAQPTAPAFTTLEGEAFELSPGKPAYLKFWASWCGTCLQEMPHLQGVYEQYGDDVRVVSINLGVNDDVEAMEEVRREYGLTMPIAVDASGELAKTYGLMATPYHVLLDADLEVVYRGYQASPELDQAIMLLADGRRDALPEVAIAESGNGADIDVDSEGVTALFFLATWCDWYLEDSRPAMASNCVAAQHAVNALQARWPGVEVIGIASRLWTSDSELDEYRDKYAVAHPLVIDTTNAWFIDHEVNRIPTLVMMSDGEVVARVEDFEQRDAVLAEVARVVD